MKKAIKLTSHTTAMHLMVQFPSDGVVPRERFGPFSQFFVRTATEQSTEQFMAHWQVVQDLEHVDQDGNWHSEQHKGLQRVDHLETA